MEKTLFMLCVLLFSASVQAQKLSSDQTTDTYRGINCTEVNITTPQEELEISVALSFMHLFQFDLKTWSLNFTTKSELPHKFPKDSRLLIKLQDDSLLELKCMVESDSFKNYKVGRRAVNMLIYQMTEDNVKALLKGVKKLRFETMIKNIDIELSTDIMGEAIRSSYNIIQEAIKTKPKEFTDDF